MSEVHTSSLRKFTALLEISALLPKAETEFTKRYKLSRKQLYLIYLINHADELHISRLQHFAQYLNISNSTLTRNLEKLESRKIVQRIRPTEKRNSQTELKLLSVGQLYAIEIERLMEEHFKDIDLKAIFKRID